MSGYFFLRRLRITRAFRRSSVVGGSIGGDSRRERAAIRRDPPPGNGHWVPSTWYSPRMDIAAIVEKRGRVSGDLVLVDDFLNHRVDPVIIDEIGRQIAEHF